jgi:hypothetical protein
MYFSAQVAVKYNPKEISKNYFLILLIHFSAYTAQSGTESTVFWSDVK